MIVAQGIGVKFNNSTRRELKSLTFDFIHKRTIKREEFWALKDVSFELIEGEILGIIGSNGAGKSTLCRVISKILSPDTGTIRTDGMISSLLSLGTGFNAQLSGRENIFLNGMMLGFSKKHILSHYNEIVSFAGIGSFIDQPIKYYSKGMKSRLGFSIASIFEPDILILDEALSTGDEEFKHKASRKMFDIIKHAKMVIIVSHDLDFIEKRCTKVIWVDKGKVKHIGNPKQICETYKLLSIKKERKKKYFDNFHKNGIIQNNETIIKVKNSGICYKLNSKKFWALKEVNFTVKRGEVIGVIGKNGAGKSTLCKVLSGILKTDEGHVYVNGKTTELLGFGSGFNKQLSGHDNIYLNGLLLGISKQKIKTLYNDIVDFSELNAFIHKPMKQYSSGMRARLGFSIATSIDPDILIIDEALSTGDHAFHAKAAERIQETIAKSKAVIVVTHSMRFVKNICTRVLWLDKGRLLFDGKPKEAISLYKKNIKQKKAISNNA